MSDIAYGERPRLFIDMIGFVEMGHDRRSYRFLQDTRHGRVLIAETERIDRAVAAITNYIARRLRRTRTGAGRGLAQQESEPSPAETRGRARALAGGAEQRRGRPPEVAKTQGLEAPARRSRWTKVGDFFSFLLLALGSMTFCLLLAVAAYAVWEMWGRAFWTAWFGAPPF